MLPSGADAAVSWPEGNTPLIARKKVADWAGVPALQLKHEGMNPTGSFKDRGMTVGVTQAVRVGATAVACASTGNTSASMAAYAALAGIPALVLVPLGKVALGKLTQSLAYGAHTLLVRGDFDDCLRLVRDASEELGAYLLNSINPYRIEGQKTIVLEMLEQLDWDVPDWIALPAGNLGNTAAFGKALREALELGLITKLPRLLAVQSDGAAPFAMSFRENFRVRHIGASEHDRDGDQHRRAGELSARGAVDSRDEWRRDVGERWRTSWRRRRSSMPRESDASPRVRRASPACVRCARRERSPRMSASCACSRDTC